MRGNRFRRQGGGSIPSTRPSDPANRLVVHDPRRPRTTTAQCSRLARRHAAGSAHSRAAGAAGEHGDWSTNVALSTAKSAGRNQGELATQIAEIPTADPPAHAAVAAFSGPS
jgi:hypothetical protein